MGGYSVGQGLPISVVTAQRVRGGGHREPAHRLHGLELSPPTPTLLTQLFSQVHHINANYFLDITSMKPEDIENHVFSFSSTFEDPSTATYMQFLKEGLRRGLPLLQP